MKPSSTTTPRSDLAEHDALLARLANSEWTGRVAQSVWPSSPAPSTIVVAEPSITALRAGETECL